MRAVWKGVFISNYIRYKLYFNTEKLLIVTCGNVKIIDKLLNYIFLIYNGRKYYEIILQANFINFYIGQFIFSRKIGFIHKEKKKCRH